MLRYFMGHPIQYWVPMVVNLVLLVLGARFLRRFYKGEARILLDPVIIFGAATLWPFADLGLIVSVVFWSMGKAIGLIIGKANGQK